MKKLKPVYSVVFGTYDPDHEDPLKYGPVYDFIKKIEGVYYDKAIGSYVLRTWDYSQAEMRAVKVDAIMRKHGIILECAFPLIYLHPPCQHCKTYSPADSTHCPDCGREHEPSGIVWCKKEYEIKMQKFLEKERKASEGTRSEK